MRFFKSNRITKMTDAGLIAEYKKGNNEAMEILFDRYAHLVYAICFKYLKNEEESRDAVLNIFEKLLSSVKKYNIGNFSTWIYSVTKNYCVEHLKHKKIPIDENVKPEDHAEDLPSGEPYYPDDEEGAIDTAKLREALASLSEEQKRCVEMFYLQQKCYQDIADETGYTLNQVKSYIQNGKRNLKIYLSQRK
jgi:RNA polymerase sigma factor (sigma-70 family)